MVGRGRPVPPPRRPLCTSDPVRMAIWDQKASGFAMVEHVSQWALAQVESAQKMVGLVRWLDRSSGLPHPCCTMVLGTTRVPVGTTRVPVGTTRGPVGTTRGPAVRRRLCALYERTLPVVEDRNCEGFFWQADNRPCSSYLGHSRVPSQSGSAVAYRRSSSLCGSNGSLEDSSVRRNEVLRKKDDLEDVDDRLSICIAALD